MPSACHGWVEVVAASRILDNPQGGTEILAGHQQAPLERSRALAVAVLVQDTSCLNGIVNLFAQREFTGMG